MGLRGRSALPAPGPADHHTVARRRDSRPCPGGVRQLEHRRELPRHRFAADLQFRTVRLFARLSGVCRAGRHQAGDRGAERSGVRQSARSGGWPGLLQPRQLVSRPRLAAWLRQQHRQHGTDDGGQPAAAGGTGRDHGDAAWLDAATLSRHGVDRAQSRYRCAAARRHHPRFLPTARGGAGGAGKQPRRQAAHGAGRGVSAHRGGLARSLGRAAGQRLPLHDCLRRLAQPDAAMGRGGGAGTAFRHHGGTGRHRFGRAGAAHSRHGPAARRPGRTQSATRPG